MLTKKLMVTSYIKSEKFNARLKGNFFFAMALNFYTLNKK